MEKKERSIVFGTGLVLLLLFTFTDLQISLAIATKPFYARILEVVGEIPFTVLTLSGCAMIIRFRSRESRKRAGLVCEIRLRQTRISGGISYRIKKWAALLGGGVLFLLFSAMGGFMTWNYLSDNLGDVPQILIPVIGILMAGAAVWITLKVPEENRSKALRYAAAALIYFLLVILVMNSLKTVWGRMRFREMTDPVNEFTRWYQIRGRGSFDNAYASFPSGHSMNSAGVILTLLLPDLIPAWKDKQKPLRICTYAWCIVVGASRVLMGAHFASDVTVGILLSFLLFELTYTLICRRKGAMGTICY